MTEGWLPFQNHAAPRSAIYWRHPRAHNWKAPRPPMTQSMFLVVTPFDREVPGALAARPMDRLMRHQPQDRA